MDTPRSQKRCESLIDKLGSVVSLDAANGKTELCSGISTEGCDMLGDFRFVNKRSRPAEMGKIIQNDKVVAVTRNTRYWRSQDITMD